MSVQQAAVGITVRDVSAEKFIAAYTQVLKNNDKFVVPKWVDIVKTGCHKELPPNDPDWYYVRAAAVARKIYLRQGTGVGALKKRFGGSYRRGAAPERHQDAAGGCIRTILLNLDDLNITEACAKGGRKVTRTGQQALDLVAGQVARDEV
jgi:small subunit ribosomal protein S19e